MRPVAGIHDGSGVYYPVFQCHHIGKQLEGRTGFYFTAGSHVGAFRVSVAGFLEIGNGLYFPRAYFHEYGRAFFGLCPHEFLQQLFFNRLLQVYVDSAYDIKSVFGFLQEDFGASSGHLAVYRKPVVSAQHAVVIHFQAETSAFFTDAVNVAYGARGKGSERFHPCYALFHCESSLYATSSQYRKFLYFLVVYVRNRFRVYPVLRRTSFVRFTQIAFILRGCAVFEQRGQFFCQFADMQVEVFPFGFLVLYLESFHSHVHVQVVCRYGAGHEPAVVGAYVPAFGRYRVGFGPSLFGDGPQFVSFRILPIPDAEKDKDEKGADEDEYDIITQQYVAFGVVLAEYKGVQYRCACQKRQDGYYCQCGYHCSL